MYEYEVNYYVDNESCVDRGMIAGVNNFYEAMKKLLDYYGEDEIENVHMSFITDEPHVLVYKKNISSLKDYFDLV